MSATVVETIAIPEAQPSGEPSLKKSRTAPKLDEVQRKYNVVIHPNISLILQ